MNLVQFSIFLETLGAIFVAFDIIVPKRWRELLNTAVSSWVRLGNQSKSAIAATVISVLIVIGWAVITDLQSSPDNANTFPSILLMLAGMLGGIAVPLVVTQFIVFLINIIIIIFHMHVTIDRGVIVYYTALVISVIGIYGFEVGWI